MIDNIITDVPNNFIYIVIALFILYVSTKMIKAKSSHLFAALISFWIISHLKNNRDNDTSNFNNEIDYRYKLINTPSHFYLDVNLINLYFSIYKWKNLNPHNYQESINAVNNILKIELESQKKLIHCVDNYDVAYDQSKIALNMLHSFIYVIDRPLLVEKLKKVLSRLQELLSRHLKNIQSNCGKLEKDKGRVDVNTKYATKLDGPQAFDEYTQFEVY